MNELPDPKRFTAFRELVRQGIEAAFDSYADTCKSFEGAVDLGFPHMLGEDAVWWAGRPIYSLTLHLYVFGPSRHYTWTGDTWPDVFDQAEAAVRKWLEQDGLTSHVKEGES